jgi:hypothetical protein
MMLNQVPPALTNPAYILLCLVFAILGFQLAYARGSSRSGRSRGNSQRARRDLGLLVDYEPTTAERKEH